MTVFVCCFFVIVCLCLCVKYFRQILIAIIVSVHLIIGESGGQEIDVTLANCSFSPTLLAIVVGDASLVGVAPGRLAALFNER